MSLKGRFLTWTANAADKDDLKAIHIIAPPRDETKRIVLYGLLESIGLSDDLPPTYTFKEFQKKPNIIGKLNFEYHQAIITFDKVIMTAVLKIMIHKSFLRRFTIGHTYLQLLKK